jgi:MYXO-CTERM domain-containing protein
MQRVFGFLGAVLFVSAAVPARAASITGVVDDGTTGLPNMEVRLWAQTPKGYSLQAADAQVVPTAADGTYAITGIPAGSYKLDARMGPLMTGNWGDRWLDVQPPVGGGYLESDADVLVLDTMTDLTNITLTLERNGGLDGTVLVGSTLTAGIQIIAERRDEPRIHHRDRSQDMEHPGEFSMRGLQPGPYRVIAHDPNAQFSDVVHAPALDVVSNVDLVGPALELLPATADALEPNNTADTATAIDSNLFAQDPPLLFAPVGTRIAPRNSGDVDWYCYDARATDRFKIHARGVLTLEDATVRENPFVDPVLSLWTPGDGGLVKILEDDDNGPGTRDALLDTGELAAAARHCVAVSTYGDTAFNGTTQASAGDYALTVELGNRGPLFGAALVTPDGGVPPPLTVDLAEGETITFNLTFSDPDHDALNASWDLRTATNTSQSAGSLDTSTGTGTFSWTATQTAARGSPYTLVLTVTDGEFTRTVTVLIRVSAVNVSPELPVLLTPTNGESIQTQGPRLICAESYDPDLQTLSYEVEVYFGDGGVPARTGSAIGVDGGYEPDSGQATPTVQWQVTGIPENTRARWRVRAFDGDPNNGYSGWTAFSHFLVDLMNDPPPPPLLTKPTFNEVINLLRPTLSVVTPVDPEDDPVEVSFEISSTQDFAAVLVTSPWIPVTAAVSTMWTTETDLSWDTRYFARARARDNRGGVGEYSNTNPFLIQSNQRPGVPPFLTPTAAVCNSGTVPVFPSTVVVGQVVDPEMDAITIQLQVFDVDVDPDTATPVLDLMQAQGTGATTSFDVAAVMGQQLRAYRMRVRSADATGPSPWGGCRVLVDNGMNVSSSSSNGSSGPTSGMSSGGGSGSSGGGVNSGGGSSGVVIQRPDAGAGEEPEDPKGCGCQTTSAPPPWVLLGLVWLMRRVRRGLTAG